MDNITKELNKFNKIQFNEELHEYTVNSNKLTSVTTFIEQNFKPKFPRKFLAEKIAKRDNKTTDQVLQEWTEIANYGKDLGTKCHNYAEMVMKNQSVTIYNDSNFIHRINLFNNFWIDHFQNNVNTWTEIQVYSEKLKIAFSLNAKGEQWPASFWMRRIK